LDYILARCPRQIVFERVVLAAVHCQRLDSLTAGLQSPHQDKLSFECSGQVPYQGTKERNAGLPGHALGDLKYKMLKLTIDFARWVHAHGSWN